LHFLVIFNLKNR